MMEQDLSASLSVRRLAWIAALVLGLLVAGCSRREEGPTPDRPGVEQPASPVFAGWFSADVAGPPIELVISPDGTWSQIVWGVPQGTSLPDPPPGVPESGSYVPIVRRQGTVEQEQGGSYLLVATKGNISVGGRNKPLAPGDAYRVDVRGSNPVVWVLDDVVPQPRTFALKAVGAPEIVDPTPSASPSP